MSIHKWGGLAAFSLPLSFIVAPWIYLTGNLHTPMGIFAYRVADFLYGPLLAASLILLAYTLRERIGARAARRMDLALLAAALAAVGVSAVAFLRASNRDYTLLHPGLDLENSVTVLVAWTTLVAGANALGFHFLGWFFILLGSAGWTSRLLPRWLVVLYLLSGALSWFVYLFAELEGVVLLFGAILGLGQGRWFWEQ
jgi:hypothetical protein